MEPDMNFYDLEHVTVNHPNMSKESWQQFYRAVWEQYYTPEHVETVIRRAAAKGQNINKVTSFLTCFYGCTTIEGVHPLEGPDNRYVPRAEARRDVFDYIERFYNRQRLHSHSKGLPPEAYAKQNEKTLNQPVHETGERPLSTPFEMGIFRVKPSVSFPVKRTGHN